MTSQAVERTRIRTGGSGANVLIKRPKSRLLRIFSPDFTINSQIQLLYAEKWTFPFSTSVIAQDFLGNFRVTVTCIFLPFSPVSLNEVCSF